MKKQPQKPLSFEEILSRPSRNEDETLFDVFKEKATMDDIYISHLEQENTALKERVAELEDQVQLLDHLNTIGWAIPEVK